MKPRILLIEDDPISAKLATNILREIEAEVTHVVSGEEAVALFEAEQEFELVLLDLYLPGMSGFTTWEKIRGTEQYRLRRIPVVALTSNALMEPKAQFLKTTGFTDYVAKPVRKDTFPDFVRKLLPASAPTAKLSWY